MVVCQRVCVQRLVGFIFETQCDKCNVAIKQSAIASAHYQGEAAEVVDDGLGKGEGRGCMSMGQCSMLAC